MTRALPAYVPTPRILNKYQLRVKLNMSDGTFNKKRLDFEKAGLPQFDPLLGGWDEEAVEAWLDKRAGLSDSCEAVDADKELERWEASQCGTL